MRKPIARHEQHRGTEAARQPPDLGRQVLYEMLALGAPVPVASAETCANFARHETAALVKPAAHRYAEQRTVRG